MGEDTANTDRERALKNRQQALADLDKDTAEYPYHAETFLLLHKETIRSSLTTPQAEMLTGDHQEILDALRIKTADWDREQILSYMIGIHATMCLYDKEVKRLTALTSPQAETEWQKLLRVGCGNCGVCSDGLFHPCEIHKHITTPSTRGDE